MAISPLNTKLLWGRAAGICSRPGCNSDLTKILTGGDGYTLGQMAHVIAKAPSGPRGDGTGGDNSYSNLILLCPTCHTEIDNSPEGTFTEENIFEWKKGHEKNVASLGADQSFSNFKDLAKYISPFLEENKVVWLTFGPKSDVAVNSPGSNLHQVWLLRRLDVILPNNRIIVNSIKRNMSLLNAGQRSVFAKFYAHASSYEEHVYNRLDSYPTFPKEFQEEFLDVE